MLRSVHMGVSRSMCIMWKMVGLRPLSSSALLEKSLPGTQHWEAEGQVPLPPNPPGFPNLCMLTASFSLAFINS